MTESEFYQRYVRKLEAIMDLARIENGLGSGFPDICAAASGKQFLIETKVSKLHAGADTLFFEKFQIPFAMKRLRYTDNKGMFVMALTSGGEHICIYEMSAVVAAPRSVYKKWTIVTTEALGTPFQVVDRPFNTYAIVTAGVKMLKAL